MKRIELLSWKTISNTNRQFRTHCRTFKQRSHKIIWTRIVKILTFCNELSGTIFLQCPVDWLRHIKRIELQTLVTLTQGKETLINTGLETEWYTELVWIWQWGKNSWPYQEWGTSHQPITSLTELSWLISRNLFQSVWLFWTILIAPNCHIRVDDVKSICIFSHNIS